MIAAALITLAVALVASWWGTGLVRRFAMARSLLDVPNQWSSHSSRTPRGGGVAIVVAVLAGILVGAAGGWIRNSIALALVPSGTAVALVSWLDDRRSVPRWIRLLVHLAAAAWVVYCFGPVETLEAGATLHLGLVGPIVTVLGITWAANLFNFMDGIDGLAAGEALSVGLAAMLLCWRNEDLEPTWLAALVVVAVYWGSLASLHWFAVNKERIEARAIVTCTPRTSAGSGDGCGRASHSISIVTRCFSARTRSSPRAQTGRTSQFRMMAAASSTSGAVTATRGSW